MTTLRHMFFSCVLLGLGIMGLLLFYTWPYIPGSAAGWEKIAIHIGTAEERAIEAAARDAESAKLESRREAELQKNAWEYGYARGLALGPAAPHLAELELNKIGGYYPDRFIMSYCRGSQEGARAANNQVAGEPSVRSEPADGPELSGHGQQVEGDVGSERSRSI